METYSINHVSDVIAGISRFIPVLCGIRNNVTGPILRLINIPLFCLSRIIDPVLIAIMYGDPVGQLF